MSTLELSLKPNKICVQPIVDNGSFTSEHKKYDRKAIAVVKQVSDYITGLKVGDKVVYDDSHSIDFTLGGVELSIITPDEIVATIIGGEE